MHVLQELTEGQLQALSRCLLTVTFADGETILRQGEVGDCFYLLARGEVAVQVNHIQVATLQGGVGGSFFGEMSLLSNERRSATAMCSVWC
ncbi:cyclic nucleotide-binding-like protein [Ochromonadaceae sp. CCMP2298]|nr:cyclic nucleotide-binding-like protein [Ochromonadaceae sp. CCMP2298]